MQSIKDTSIDFYLNWLLNSSVDLLEKCKKGEIKREECVKAYNDAEGATRAKLPEAIGDYLKEHRKRFYQAMKALE